MKDVAATKGDATKPGSGLVQALFDMVGAAPSQMRLPSASSHHPLDNLLPDEIRAASKVCRDHAQKLGLPKLRFNSVSLQVLINLAQPLLQSLRQQAPMLLLPPCRSPQRRHSCSTKPIQPLCQLAGQLS